MAATMQTRAPVAKHLRDMLTDLFSRNVEVSSASPYAPAADEPATVATYVDDSGVVRAVLACDLRFSAYAGAAIGLVPLTAAQVALEERVLTQSLTENLHEVLNVSAAVFNGEGLSYLRLHDMYGPDDATPSRVLACTRTLGSRLDLTVDIAGYGQGKVSAIGLG